MQPTEYYRQDKTPWFVKIMWCVHVIAVAATLPITIVYWAVVFRPSAGDVVTAATVHVHGVNLLLVVLDIFISRIPILILHFFYPMVYAAVYVVFLGIYWAVGGTNENGDRYVYSVADFEKMPVISSVVCVGLIIAAGIIHLLFYVLAEIRDQIYKRIRFCFWNVQDTGVVGTSLSAYELGQVVNQF